MSTDSERAREAALEAWRALPEDERNGERPYIMGFNAGWDEALKAADTIERLQARVAELEGAVKDVTVHLIAAVSILINAQKAKKPPAKVIASDRMFLLMLADYDKSIERGRKASQWLKQGDGG